MTIQVPQNYVKDLIRSGICLEHILSSIICYSDDIEESEALVDIAFIQEVNYEAFATFIDRDKIYQLVYHETNQ